MSVSLPGMGNQVRMQGGAARTEDGAPERTRRVVRLLVLLGVVVAAYLVLSLFDHAARADAGLVNQTTDQVASTKPVASVKAAAKRIHRPTIKAPKVHPPKVHTVKVHTVKGRTVKAAHVTKIQAPKIRVSKTVQRVQVRTSKVRQIASAVIGETSRAKTLARAAIVQQKLPAPPPALTELPSLPQATAPGWTQLPSLPQAHSLPQATGWTQPPSMPQAHSLPPARTAPLPRTTVLPTATAAALPYQPLPQPPSFATTAGLSGGRTPPAAQAQPQTAPLPTSPRQPADRTTPAGQARDSGTGNAPTMDTVPSAWRPEIAPATNHRATYIPARGRTVRYAGPPS